MRRRYRFATWLLLALVVGAGGWFGQVLLWAQEGALDSSVEEEVAEQREEASSLAPSAGESQSEPVTIYEGEVGPPEEQKSTRWGNMNWFALYLVLVGPTAYFVFRGVSR